MESWEDRLRRFLSGGPEESLGNLIESIGYTVIPQLKKAAANKCDDLLLLGAHAVMQTCCQYIYGKRGKEGTRFFLKEFVDGVTDDRRYSIISDELHDIRNTIAHQWLCRDFHNLIFDHGMPEGWKRVNGVLLINPRIFAEQFFVPFDKGLFWNSSANLKHLTESDLVVRKYEFIIAWLGEQDIVGLELKKLRRIARSSGAGDELARQEEAVKSLLLKRHSLSDE